MARVKRSLNAKKKRRAILNSAKGYRGQRSRLYRKAKEQWVHSMTYAYRDRRARKSEFRKLWITRINAACRQNGVSYSRFINGLKQAGIEGTVANFFKVIARNGRMFAAPAIIAAFRELAARRRGEVTAEVTSAEPLSETHLAALKEALKGALGKDVTLDTRVDPSLIGGLIVKVGSRMIDSSLKTKLTSLKLAMKEVG